MDCGCFPNGKLIFVFFGGIMIPFIIELDDTVAEFYAHVANDAGLPVETVLSDTLFKLAGELSLEALAKQRKTECNL